MKIKELLEGQAGVKVVQSKKAQKKLRDAPGHYHKNGGDWEDTTVTQPKKKPKNVK